MPAPPFLRASLPPVDMNNKRGRDAYESSGKSTAPSRSGIGLDADEWEAPERLSTNLRRTAPSTVSSTPLTSNESVSTGRSGQRGDEWDRPTPMRGVGAPGTDLTASNKPRTILNSKLIERLGYHVEETPEIEPSGRYNPGEEDGDFDRDFYLSEEGQTFGDDGNGGGHFLGNEDKFKAREEAMSKSRAKGDTKIAGMSARKSQLYVDQEAWEENRLLQSGVASLREAQMDFNDEDDSRVTLIVHNVKPPFLDGRVSFSLQQTTVSILKDPTGDMAVNARKGSALLRDVREKRDVMKMRKRFWELGGSRMGDVMGIAHPEEEKDEVIPATGLEVGDAKNIKPAPERKHIDDVDEDEEGVDYRDGSSFGKHMKDIKAVAQSDFARTKTIKEQREYLPVYTCRSRLMDVVRENQVIVVVGET
eukprot:gene29037-32790_t